MEINLHCYPHSTRVSISSLPTIIFCMIVTLTSCSPSGDTQVFLSSLDAPMWSPDLLANYKALISAKTIEHSKRGSGYFVAYPESDDEPMGYIGVIEKPARNQYRRFGKMVIDGCRNTGSYYDVYWDFEEFRIVFIYPNHYYEIALGAQVFSDDGSLIAEARVPMKSFSDELFVVQEQHYNQSGEIVFWRESHFYLFDGSHHGVLKQHGHATGNYFTKWPVCYTCTRNPQTGEC